MQIAPTVSPCTSYTVAELAIGNGTFLIVIENDLFRSLSLIDFLLGVIGKTDSGNEYSLPLQSSFCYSFRSTKTADGRLVDSEHCKPLRFNL